jgi:hypothetical protein
MMPYDRKHGRHTLLEPGILVAVPLDDKQAAELLWRPPADEIAYVAFVRSDTDRRDDGLLAHTALVLSFHQDRLVALDASMGNSAATELVARIRKITPPARLDDILAALEPYVVWSRPARGVARPSRRSRRSRRRNCWRSVSAPTSARGTPRNPPSAVIASLPSVARGEERGSSCSGPASTTPRRMIPPGRCTLCT